MQAQRVRTRHAAEGSPAPGATSADAALVAASAAGSSACAPAESREDQSIAAASFFFFFLPLLLPVNREAPAAFQTSEHCKGAEMSQ